MSLKNIPLILLSKKLGYEQYVENKITIVKRSPHSIKLGVCSVMSDSLRPHGM